MIRLRRSVLFVPGSSPKMHQKAAGLPADALILDLEDAVAPSAKEEARALTCKALRELDFGEKEVMVRVNARGSGLWEGDLEALMPTRPSTIVLPKVSSPVDVEEADRFIGELEEAHGIARGETRLAAMVETARGLQDAAAIASASARMTALLFGAADFTAEVGGRLTPEALELLYPMSRVKLAAAAAGIDALDSPCFNIKDMVALERQARRAADLGFAGKTLIHPAQIEVVNRVFSPTEEEIAFARKVIEAYEKAEAEGKGVSALEGELVEAPIVMRARRVLLIAERAGRSGVT